MSSRPRPPAPPANPPGGGGAGSGSIFEALVIAAVMVFAGAAALAWAGAALASWAAGARFDAGLAEAGRALLRFPSHAGDPAAAWPPSIGDGLPGPVLYWTCQAAVVVAVVAAGVVALHWRSGRRERDGLGVERSARFAERHDLRQLFVRRARTGRIVMGRACGHLVATEPRTNICVIGPTQSGKTTSLCAPALLELRRGGGAVLALSVKADLYEATHRRRGSIGDVKVFDPTRIRKDDSNKWSPLRPSVRVTGAQQAARSLFELAARSGITDADYWMDSGVNVLWPLLWLAANIDGGTMTDVVAWVTTHDRPRQDRHGRDIPSVVEQHLKAIEARVRVDGTDPGGPTPREVIAAANAIRGSWVLDGRTVSNIYSTIRTIVDPWSDPVVADASDGQCDITPEWLLGGDNTLYVVAPSHDQRRLIRVFASLVADLVHASFDTASRTPGGELPRRLLVLLDEAANICPVKELPSWCSTAASHGITLVTIWQDRSQQRSRYGPDEAETIWNNSGARLILSGTTDAATVETVRHLGTEDHSRVGSSVDVGAGQGRRSVNTQTASRPLIGGDSLRRQPPGQALLIYKHLPPVRLQLRPWNRDRHLRSLHACRRQRAVAFLRRNGRMLLRRVRGGSEPAETCTEASGAEVACASGRPAAEPQEGNAA